ncbi:hypothetical protein CEP52_010747 [Fusarium oligoseptatum]|uniref:C2H2-type domain-containing protein n=1 Tax=Fusarium oligoseptatum TaxID=2604345 RepID=A0A428T6P7_9HYPO|nr:hypothetical protein CEP52_010747 [Fusarium oligoseptatum]
MSSSDLGCCALDDCDLLSLFLDDNLPQLAPDPPCDSTSTSPQGTKRRFNDNEQLGESSMHEVVVSRKRPRGDGNFSCPYRRRNPRVFNVRDFPTCAQNSFSSITLVKRHVMAAHQAKDFNTQCETCSAWFRTEKALNSHINNRSCSNLLFPAVDEHDKGITDDIENKLRDRRSRTKVLNWDDLWRTIFPSSQVIGSSDFVPVREHGEERE